MRLFFIIPVFTLLLTLPGFSGEKGVVLGLDRLVYQYSHTLKGKRVALLTNQTGVSANGQTAIDLFHNNPNINLVKLFSPEHGIRGEYKAGKEVGNAVDRKTGVKIYSLYGRFGFKPTAKHLSDVDVLVYDIQDVGSRAYTYIWSLAECLEACGEKGIPLIVLDRPCPFGANTIDGPLCLPQKPTSLITKYPIPRLYGMTVGEIARYFNRTQNFGCKVMVMPMLNYKRGMSFNETGLKWIAPSPNIPDTNAAYCFPVTGTIGNLGELHIGIRTPYPFQIIGAPWLNANALANWLNKTNLPGVIFKAGTFTPQKGFMHGKKVNFIYLHVHKPSEFKPALTEISILYYLQHAYPQQLNWENKYAFDRAMGTPKVRESIIAGKTINQIMDDWNKQQAWFRKQREKCLIY